MEKYTPEYKIACGRERIPAPKVAVMSVKTLPLMDPFENFRETNFIGHRIFFIIANF